MESEVSTSRSAGDRDGVRDRVGGWLLLQGDRRLVSLGIVVLFVVWFATASVLGLLEVGSSGFGATLFASGLTSGVLTLVTVALSINQLVLSRVFGSPKELNDRLAGTRELREHIESVAGTPSTPIDPASFLSLLATTLRDRASTLRETMDTGDETHPDEVTDAIRDIEAYGANIDDHLEEQTAIIDVLQVVLGTEYAENLTAIQHIRSGYADEVRDEIAEELDTMEELLEAIAVTRQFFKTISLQEDLAKFSRLIVYTGLLALLVVLSLALVYRTNGVMVPPSLMPALVSVGIGAIVSPFAVFLAYVLRAATIARHTVSVGPFVPPEER
ncbi:hypothetical protein [Haloarchaeobius sp. HRN-SO-5]|uniref:hypothetical protein n=1 Tax=Haloarchaeobius sp. HRN-SO-5 TaxID=3446118 RepID=UPI003EBFF16F